METQHVAKTDVITPALDKAFWEQHVKNYHASGLLRTDYCRANQINYARFGYWLRKFTSPAATTSLVPVKVKLAEAMSNMTLLSTLCLSNQQKFLI